MSDPNSPDHSTSCSCVAGHPISSFAPCIAVAALPLPPPNPACAGTHLIKFALKKQSVFPVFSLIKFKARMTKLESSVGTPSILHVNSSTVGEADESRRDNSSVSPNLTVWKRDAKSWKLSGRFRKIRKKRLILQGECRISCFSSPDEEVVVVADAGVVLKQQRFLLRPTTLCKRCFCRKEVVGTMVANPSMVTIARRKIVKNNIILFVCLDIFICSE
mmetsp:Transcript_15138/g.20627  ORF Transcript_15138/g.20627 Transcript_15138/m.20627 type:complete len:218 (+) Transcript_15138:574-1227(+)